MRIVPRPLLVKGWAKYSRLRARSARRAFERSTGEPAWLDKQNLAKLQDHYPPVVSSYSYDAQSIRQRARETADLLIHYARNEGGKFQRFLDLGAWDGMVCFELKDRGISAMGIDIRSQGLSQVARQSRINFGQMDASMLGLEDNSIDFAFSINSFEHFPDPSAVLAEMVRVIRPDGLIYLNFGPLYFSSRGAHQFSTIHVPYCECLFTNETLSAFAADRGLELTDFAWMNEWPLSRYRQLWRTYERRLEKVHYYEIFDARHTGLIERFSSCFRDKTDCFDDLIVSNIEVLFRKRSQPPS